MSLFTVALICVIAVSIFIEAFRGFKQGIVKVLMRFGVILISMISAAITAISISDLFAQLLSKPIFNIKGVDIIFVQFPNLNKLVPAYVDAVITPFLFLLLFIILRIIFTLCANQILKKVSKKEKNISAAPKLSLISTLVGALCGFLCATTIVSPLLGTLNIACNAAEIIEKNEKYIIGISLNKDEINALKKYSSDKNLALIRKYTTDTSYRTLAVSSVNGEKISLTKEVENIDSIMSLYSQITTMLRESTYSSQNNSIDKDLEVLSSSPTFKLIVSDFLSEASKAWLAGEKYMGLSKFSSGDLIDPVINEMLQVCTETTPDSSIKDLSTILHIYILAIKNELVSSDNYVDILKKINEENILTEFCNELEKNERMAYISEGIWELSIRAVSFMIQNYEYGEGEYLNLMQQYASFLNSVNGYKYEERIEKIAFSTNEYISEAFDISIPYDVCKAIAEAMDSEINPADGIVRPSDIIKFFNSYS